MTRRKVDFVGVLPRTCRYLDDRWGTYQPTYDPIRKILRNYLRTYFMYGGVVTERKPISPSLVNMGQSISGKRAYDQVVYGSRLKIIGTDFGAPDMNVTLRYPAVNLDGADKRLDGFPSSAVVEDGTAKLANSKLIDELKRHGFIDTFREQNQAEWKRTKNKK